MTDIIAREHLKLPCRGFVGEAKLCGDILSNGFGTFEVTIVLPDSEQKKTHLLRNGIPMFAATAAEIVGKPALVEAVPGRSDALQVSLQRGGMDDAAKGEF